MAAEGKLVDFPGVPEEADAPVKRPWAAYSPLVRKGALSIVDQGLISGSNFLVSVVLARWLSESAYGAYSLAYVAFLYVSLVQQALVLEPMSVFGAADYRDQQRDYLGTVVWINTALALLTFLALAASALVAEHLHPGGQAGKALAGASFAGPCVLLFWVARRAVYLQFAPGRAARAAMIYSALLVAGLALLYRLHILSPFKAFLLMGTGALLTSFILLARLRPRFRSRSARMAMRHISRIHWEYGRWALATSALQWIPGNIYLAIIGGFHGMAATGQLRALFNISQPMQQLYAAFSLLLLPYAARRDDPGRPRISGAIATRIVLLFTGGALVYWAVVVIFRSETVHLLYGRRYAEVAGLIPLIALGSLFQGAVQGPTIMLRAMKLPNKVFSVYCATSAVAIVIGVPATREFGLLGAAVTFFLVQLTAFGTASLLLRRAVRDRVPGPNAAASAPMLAAAPLSHARR
jgi:O-antigen/teichoic acid export membrane protein